MGSARKVEPELLDSLPSTDPRAIRSRRDLRRVNACMGNAPIMERTLEGRRSVRPLRRLVDLGAGDGSFLLGLAKRLAPEWPAAEVILIDRHDLVANEALEAFALLGWRASAICVDAFDWLEGDAPGEIDLIVANLFLHHFSGSALQTILHQIARRTHTFVSCDPRRSVAATAGARLLWLLGCNAVTRHDAVVSVRAGFRGHELSGLWPDEPGWQLTERPAGIFGHCFLAERTGDSGCANSSTVQRSSDASRSIS